MLYWLLYQKLFPYFRLFRIFRYVTFRCVFASLTALLIGMLIGPFVIERLREFQIGQYIREDGPQSHQKKGGTPTMGGVLICISIVVPTLLWSDLSNPLVWVVVLSTLAFAAIGFADDYIKVVKKRSLGLTCAAEAGAAVSGECGGGGDAAVAGGAGRLLDAADGAVCEGISAEPDYRQPAGMFRTSGRWRSLPFVLFVMLVITGSSNAVNLTDGLDGLAIGCTIIAAGALTMLTYVSGHVVFSDYLELQRMPLVSELTIYLRGDGGGEHRVPLVQRASGGDLYGRCGIADAGRRDCDGGGGDQAGAAAAVYRRRVHHGGAERDSAGG